MRSDPRSTTLPPALELRGVRAAYGRIEVLRGVDLVVPAGCVFALLGPNGAGKTTTLMVVNGRLTPTAGCVHIGGVHVNGASTARLARAGVCSIPEGRGIFPNLTVDENLLLVTYSTDRSALRHPRRSRSSASPSRRATDQVAGTLSGGEQQMLAMARALTVEPVAPAPRRAVDGAGPGHRRGALPRRRRPRPRGHHHPARRAVRPRRAPGRRLRRASCSTAASTSSASPADIAGDIDEAYLGGSAA